MRDTVKFFRSYRDAARELAKTDVEAAYSLLIAILDYGLDDIAPELTGGAAATWIVIKSFVDVSIQKSEAGAKGGSRLKANASKQEAEWKQNGSTLEANTSKQEPKEESRKKKEESKNVESTPKAPTGAKRTDAEFEIFWSAYPTKVGKQSARKAFDKVKVPVETLVAAIERQKCSSQWSKDGGRYIPNPATWLNQERWNDQLPEAKKTAWNHGRRDLDVDEVAAIRRMMEEDGREGGAR